MTASRSVSSHILMDVEKVIDHVWFLREGALVADEGLDELYERYAEWEVSAAGDGAALPREFEDMFVLEQSGDGPARRLVVKAKEEERRFFEGKYGVDVVARPLGLERLFPLLAKG